MDYTVHGILQARVLEWIAFPFSRSSQPRDQTQVSRIAAAGKPTRLPCPWDSPGKNTGVVRHFLLNCMQVKSESEVAQSCPTLSDPMDCIAGRFFTSWATREAQDYWSG